MGHIVSTGHIDGLGVERWTLNREVLGSNPIVLVNSHEHVSCPYMTEKLFTRILNHKQYYQQLWCMQMLKDDMAQFIC